MELIIENTEGVWIWGHFLAVICFWECGVKKGVYACVCVYVCVTWNPYILHQAVNNHDAISQSEQLTHGIAIMSLYMTQQQSVHRKSMNSVNSANSPLTASVSTLLFLYSKCTNSVIVP
jgi:hypothetical protein